MSQGLANTAILYDEHGNKVMVALRNGAYHLATADAATHDVLDEIKLLLCDWLSSLRGDES